MSRREVAAEEGEYAAVRALPLRPPQELAPPERAARRPWHPVMWDDSIVGLPSPDQKYTDEQEAQRLQQSREYPHKQRIRNLRRLIQDGKVKPDSEMLIFFLCNKFAASDERKEKISV